MAKGGNKIFDCGHPRGPSKDFHHGSDKVHLRGGDMKGMNPAPKAHHTAPAAEYPHGHAKKNK